MRLTSAVDTNNDAQCAEITCSMATVKFQSMDYEVTVRHSCGAEIGHLKPGFQESSPVGGVELGRLHDRS
jgi:hypothetical protein